MVGGKVRAGGGEVAIVHGDGQRAVSRVGVEQSLQFSYGLSVGCQCHAVSRSIGSHLPVAVAGRQLRRLGVGGLLNVLPSCTIGF